MPNRDRVLDRLSIITALRRYAYAIDDRDFETVRDLFAPDAHLDYRASGGPVGARDEVVDWIEQGLSRVGPTQHLISNEIVTLDGPDAGSRCYLFNPLVPAGDDARDVLLLGGEYRDVWRRSPRGWRIIRRVHVVTWHGTLHG